VSLLHLGAPLEQARVVCVVVHGRGQTPEDMVDSLTRRLTAPDVVYVLPRAEGKSWYTAKAVDPLTEVTRGQLAASLAVLGEAVALARGRPLLVAGFSQGACLSLEHAFRHGPWAGGLVAFTGCRVGRAGDARPAETLAGMPVYLSGGDADPWIPVSAFAEAAAALASAQARLRADVFPGRAHEISALELAVLDEMLGDLAAGRPVTWGASR
jgi:phospholipase/carboxylesterase